LYGPQKRVHATVDVLDLPGLSFADQSGRAAARRVIAKIRTVDMLVLVVKAFAEPSVPALGAAVGARRDLSELRNELLLSDLEMVATRIERLEQQVARPTKTQAQDKAELSLHRRLQEAIEAGQPIRAAIRTEGELAAIRSLGLLTLKPMAVVANVGEGDVGKQLDLGEATGGTVPVVTMCAKLEHELSLCDADSRAAFMAHLGIEESAAEAFVRICYAALGLVSFLTVGPDEVRAWPIRKGTTAVDAAGKVHSDIKRGFIRAERMAYDDLRALGHEKAVRAAGRVRLEGKEYVVADGDIINFRYSV
jgi:GTP-binding protein YchF